MRRRRLGGGGSRRRRVRKDDDGGVEVEVEVEVDAATGGERERECEGRGEWSRHFCYALANGRGRTYVGYTVDPLRRLRQHNGELAGGARRTSTSLASWRFLFVVAVEDADGSFGAHEGLSLEWHLKNGRGGGGRRGRGSGSGSGRRTPAAANPTAARIARLAEALSLPKFARFADRFVVLAADDVVDDAWAALLTTLQAPCCVLPICDYFFSGGGWPPPDKK